MKCGCCARFINSNRTINPAFGTLSNEQLKEQVRFTFYLQEHRINLCRLRRIGREIHLHLSLGMMNRSDLYCLLGLKENILLVVQNYGRSLWKGSKKDYVIFLSTFQSRFQKKSHLDGYGELIISY